MTFGGFFILILALFVGGIIWALVIGQQEREKVAAMSPEDQSNYLFGAINANLICPHCQTKGVVHVKRVSRVATSTGKVGGILKADTKSTVTTVVTQHHCDQCSSTWDI